MGQVMVDLLNVTCILRKGVNRSVLGFLFFSSPFHLTDWLWTDSETHCYKLVEKSLQIITVRPSNHQFNPSTPISTLCELVFRYGIPFSCLSSSSSPMAHFVHSSVRSTSRIESNVAEDEGIIILTFGLWRISNMRFGRSNFRCRCGCRIPNGWWKLLEDGHRVKRGFG